MLWTSLSMFNNIQIRRFSPTSHLLFSVFCYHLSFTISSYPPTCLLPHSGTAVTASMVPWKSGSTSIASCAFGKKTFTQHTKFWTHRPSMLKHIRAKLLAIASLVADARPRDIIPMQMYLGEFRPSIIRKQLRWSGTVANVCIYPRWLFCDTNSWKVVTAPRPRALRSSVSAANIVCAPIVPQKIVNLLFGYSGLKRYLQCWNTLEPQTNENWTQYQSMQSLATMRCPFHDSFHSFGFYLFILEYRSLVLSLNSVMNFC